MGKRYTYYHHNPVIQRHHERTAMAHLLLIRTFWRVFLVLVAIYVYFILFHYPELVKTVQGW